MKIRILLITVLFVLIFQVHVFSAPGTSGAEFLKIDVGARPAGLAGAFTAVSDETSGMFYNPAGLGYLLSPELQTMYALWPADLYYGYMGYCHPTFAGTFGLGIQYLSSPATTKISNGVKQGSFSYYDSALNLLYAKRMSETSSFGFTLKGISSKIDTDSASSITMDAGLLFRTLQEGFSFGFSGQNLFGKIADDPLPVSGKIGMAFKALMPEHNSELLFTMEAGQSERSPVYYAAGLEHWGARVLGLRAGYRYIADDKVRDALEGITAFTGGLSLRIKSIAVDYAYKPFGTLDKAHRVTFTWRTFGWAQNWRNVPAKIKAEPVIFSPNNDGAKDSVFFVPEVTEIKEVKKWELKITDKNKNLLKSFSGKDVLPKILSWEGQTDTSGQVSEGKYMYVFVAEGDGNKRAKTEIGEIMADLTVPVVSLGLSSSTFTPNGDGIEDNCTFYISVTDAYGIAEWKLSILNSADKTVKVYKSTSQIPMELVWDGKDEYYSMIVPNGEYILKLLARDNAGNRIEGENKIIVNIPPKVQVVPKEIKVKEEARGLVVNISSQILYKIGKYELRPQAYNALDEVVELLKTYPKNNVMIEGYTDSSGSKQRNEWLSSKRAWAIYSYLVKHGIAPSRLKVKGYGSTKPVASNRTSAGRALNRRVEIIILKEETPSQ